MTVLKGEILEVRNIDGLIRVSRKYREPDEGDPPIEPYDPMVRARSRWWSTTRARRVYSPMMGRLRRVYSRARRVYGRTVSDHGEAARMRRWRKYRRQGIILSAPVRVTDTKIGWMAAKGWLHPGPVTAAAIRSRR